MNIKKPNITNIANIIDMITKALIVVFDHFEIDDCCFGSGTSVA